MPQHITIELEMPDDLARFHLPKGLDQRLQDLLDKQDRGEPLSAAERQEAEGLVNIADLLMLLQARVKPISPKGSSGP
jgi:hypothetical protein